MISPQATQLGYGWEDTLAHEITHLALARATRDRAPLWLQEGIAKRQESRWREARPGDGEPSADSVAYVAMQQGKAVGIDKLGPSIAMLPTPEAASIAYAEVQSFVNYWIVQNGEAALKLLFQDLKGLGAQSADAALTSVSGYTLAEWNLKWRDHLRQHPPAAPARHLEAAHDAQSLARWVRLSDLFYELGHYHAASEAMAPALVPAGKLAAVRWRAARAALADKRPEDAKNALGQVSDIDVLHGAWFAMHGRFLEQDQPAQAKVAHDLALSVDPLFDEVACQGRRHEEASPKASHEREALCRTARQLRR